MSPDENLKTWGSVKGKKVRTTLDDTGEKSVSEKSKSAGGKCVSDKRTKNTNLDFLIGWSDVRMRFLTVGLVRMT